MTNSLDGVHPCCLDSRNVSEDHTDKYTDQERYHDRPCRYYRGHAHCGGYRTESASEENAHYSARHTDQYRFYQELERNDGTRGSYSHA